MPLIDIIGDPGIDNLVGFIQRGSVTASHLGGDLEPDMNELPERRIVLSLRLIVLQRGNKFIAAPALHLCRVGKFFRIDVDDGKIRLRQFIEALE